MQILPLGWNSLGDALCVQHGSDFFPESLHFPSPEVEAQAVMKDHQETIAVGRETADVEAILQNFVIRRERQTFRKLKHNGGLLFAVHTTLTFIKDLPDAELQSLLGEVAAWSDDMAAYRDRHVWAGWLEKEAQSRGLK
jgi:hypothetical protein